METIVTTEKTAASITINVEIDKKSAAIIAVAVFVALLGALIIYKKI